MADTAQSDQFSIFFRKIGYSVGLEHTLDRISDLTHLYVEKHEVSLSDWRALVRDEWELENEHIADVFGALGYLKRTGHQLHVQPNLDISAICLSETSEEQFDRANQFVLLNAIVENDGEIFLNCVKSGFEREKIESSLKRLIAYKRDRLFKIFPSADVQRRIARVINIDSQPTNMGGRSAGQLKRLSDLRRVEGFTRRKEPLNSAPSLQVTISDDYFRKVPPRRRDWARSVGLIDSAGTLTEFGDNLLEQLQKLGCITPDGDVVLWPFTHEIARLRMIPTLFGHEAVSQWDLVKAIFRAQGLTVDMAPPTEPAATTLVAELHRQFEFYRRLDLPKSILRQDYPLTIAILSIGGIRFGQKGRLPALPEFIELERAAEKRRLDMRTSRTYLGSLVFRI